MEVSIEHLGAVQFEIKIRDHVLISDQPPANGGFDEGVTPPELLLASLGSCAGYYAAEFLRKQALAGEGVRVFVSAQKAKNPARLEDFLVRVDSPVALTAAQQDGLARAIHGCLVHNTLLHPPRIVLEIHEGSLEPVGGERPTLR